MVKAIVGQTKAFVNLYTWTTLPFYSIYQQPWRRLALNKDFNVIKKVDSLGRLIYSRPLQPNPGNVSHDKYYQYKTFPELFDVLDRSKPVVGIRDVLEEKVAKDSAGKPILLENRVLKKLTLADDFRWHTVGQVMDHVDKIARGLRQAGVGKGTKVLIYAENGIEWFYTLLALSRINAVVVTLFSTLGDSGVVYGINQSESQFVVTSQSLMPKLNKLSNELNDLKAIVYIPDRMNKECGGEAIQKLGEKFPVMSLDQIRETGKGIPECKFEPPTPDDLFMIMYTSGE